MEENPLKNIEKEKIKTLREKLGIIFAYPEFSTLGHGTSEPAAKEILKNGLILSNSGDSLTEATFGLFDASKAYDEQPDEQFEKILHWPHKNYKHIVTIMIPNPTEAQNGGLRYFNSVFEESMEGNRTQYVLPSKFIRGYIDANTLQFIENELYDKDARVILDNNSHVGPLIHTENKNIPQPPENSVDDQSDAW